MMKYCVCIACGKPVVREFVANRAPLKINELRVFKGPK